MDPNTNSGVKRQAEYDANIENEATTSKKSQVTKAAVGVEKSEDMATNLNKGLKRQDKDEMKNVASTSNQIQVNNSAVAAIVQANATYQHYGDNYINQQMQQQQPTPEHPPRGIELEVAHPVASFRGRVEQLQLVKDAFNSPRNEKLNLVVVCGYGGIGKTEFARKFVQQHRADFDNCIWIKAEFESTMNESFCMLKDKLKDKGYSCTNKLEVYNHLNSDKSIFVFDNAENMWSIRSFLPQKKNDCLFFITSQFKNWSPYKSIPLDTLDLNSAMNIIKVILDEHEIEISESQLKTLVGKFEHIPLVLQIGAGSVCQEILDLKTIGDYNIDNIIQALNTESDLVTQEFPVFSQDSYAKSVYNALSRTLDKIWTKSDEAYKLAANILGISSYLEADGISKKMLKEIVKIEDENLFNKSLATLVQFSLLKVSYYIGIHRTVQECVRYYCVNQLKSNEYYSQALQILLLDYGFGYWHHYNVLFQHGESYLETFCTFYNDNKCRNLNRKLGKYISCQLLNHVLDKLGLIKNPEFLYEIATRKQDDIKQLLLDHGADFNVVDDQGFNALYYACLSEDGYNIKFYKWNRIQTLIEIGVDVNSINLEGNTIIHSLCNLGKICMGKDKTVFEACALLIKFGGDPKIKNNAGQTPADLAREYGLALTRHLLDTAISGYPYILHIVAECRQFKFLHNLASNDVCDMNERDNSGRTILHVLAGLAQLDAEDEVKLLYDTAYLLKYKNADMSVNAVNNADETAADVARRCGREKMADMFNAMDEPGRLILQTAALRDQLNHFQYVHSRSWNHVNEQDDTGSTLLHALCGLDTRGDTKLELDIVKLATDLVIWCHADVRIMNKASDTAAGVARRHGRLMLTDFLNYALKCNFNSVSMFARYYSNSFSKLLCFYLNHKQFSLFKYAWWRSYIFNFSRGYPVDECSKILRMLCSYEDTTATDAELIRVFNYLDLKLVAKHSFDEYYAAVVNAKQHGRDKLFVWLKRYSPCDINEQDDSGCTLLHRLSKDYGQYRSEFNEIVNLVVYCDADVSIVNNAGETAADVAQQRGEEKLADFLNAWAPPARTIYQIDAHRSKLQQFTFVNNNNVQNVNYLDDTGSTLLHALCGLDTRGDPELELDIVKLAAHLVIRCDADVHIMNNAGDTAADVARRHDRLLLADFLHPSIDPTAFNLVSISVKLKEFELVKHAWWRYLYTMSDKDMYTSADQAGCRVLRILCEIEDLTVTDAELISLIRYLYLILVAEYSNDFYNKVVTMARRNQRTELAAWLEDGKVENY